MQHATHADALLSADTLPRIIECLARWLWAKAHNNAVCPPDRIPTEAGLQRFVLDHVSQWRDDNPRHEQEWRDSLCELGAISPERRAYESLLLSGMEFNLDGHPGVYTLDTFGRRVRLCVFAPPVVGGTVEQAHEVWCDRAKPRPTHPLAPLIRAWWKANGLDVPEITVDRKRRGILPAALKTARQGRLFDKLPERLDRLTPLGAFPSESAQAYLPGLEPPKSSVIPVLPVSIYDAAGGNMQDRGQGAPIAQRLFFELMMTAKRTDRHYLQGRLDKVTLGDLVAWIWPNGWQRGRDLPKLRRALLELDNMRIAWERLDRRLIAVDDLPRYDAKLTDRVPLRLAFLPGSDHGPLIDRPQLRRFGLQSAPAWRSYLRLAYLWDDAKAKNGGHRIYATRPKVKRGRGGVLLDANGQPILKRGQPVKDWSDPRAVLLYDAEGNPKLERNPQADRVPVLDLDDLARLGFDDATDKSNRKDRSRRTRNALTDMEKKGAIVLEKHKGGWRILELLPPT